MINSVRIRNDKINKLFCILVFLFICTLSFAQKDSIHKNHLSMNLAAGIISGEVGLYYDYRLSNKVAFQLSYGHRFYNFHIIVNGGYGLNYKYFPQQGDIIRLGVKKYFREVIDVKPRSFYLTYRLSYWNLHTPKYTTKDPAASNGMNMIRREIVSEDVNALNGAFGIGRELRADSTSSFDLFFTMGVSVGQKNTHKYSYGGSGSGDDYMYPPNTIVKTTTFYPTFELGWKFGYGW